MPRISNVAQDARASIEGRRTLTLEEVPPTQWKEKLLPVWDDLLQRSVEPSIFLSSAWISSWWHHFRNDKRSLMLAGWDERGQLCGLAPFYRHRLHLPGVHDAFSLSFMGDTEVGSEYLGLLVLPGFESHFLDALSSQLQDRWVLADFCGLRERGPLCRRIVSAFSGGSPQRVYEQCHPCSLVLLPKDYDTYLTSLHPKFRSNIRYRTNKLRGNFNVRLIRTANEREIEPHLERLFAMHQARWQAEAKTGSFYDPRKRDFYRELSIAFLNKGWLRFYHLEIDGVIRASQFGFVFGGVLHSLQEAFDHEFSPRGIGGIGTVLRAMAIQESIREGLKGYDFLGGTEDHKLRWNTVTHHTIRVRIGAPGLKGAIALSASAGALKMKDWGKRRAPYWLLNARRNFAEWTESRRASRVSVRSSKVEA